MAQQDPTLRELKLILKVLILANAGAIERELSKVATTDERKKMWVLIDGKRMPKDIADQVGVTSMAVSNFVNAGMAAELIEYVKGRPPRRILDYVPPEWINLVPTPSETEKEGTVGQPGGVKKDQGDNNGKENQ